MSSSRAIWVATALMLASDLYGGDVRAGESVFIATGEGPRANPTQPGTAVGDNSIALHRFSVASPTHVQHVGGQFLTFQTQTIFAAIVRLSGPADVPDSLDLSTPDLLAHELLTLSSGEVDQSVDLPITLEPGWYALGFGSGRFGAPSLGSETVPLMSRVVDLAPDQAPFVAIQSFANGPGKFQNHNFSTPRVFVMGTIVPEPASMAILSAGLVVVVAVGHRFRA